MAVPNAVQAAYDRDLPLIRSVATVVEQTVFGLASDRDYLFKGRIKRVDSIAEKLETGRYAKWREIDDFYACSVVVPNRHHVESVLEHLDTAFRRHAVRGRAVAQKPADVFRFDAPRFIGRLRDQQALGRLPGVEDILFEVQVLTALEYAWQVATHDEVFKGDQIDWRRDRLAAELKASIEQADNLVAAFDIAASVIVASPFRATERRELVVAFSLEQIRGGGLAEHLAPTSWVRFGDNVVNLVSAYARRDSIDDELNLVLAEVARLIAEESPPVAGSLFQLFVAAVFRLRGEKGLKKYRLVESDELTSIYRIPEVPTVIRV